MKEKRLLFFGELPPDAIHGIPIQNKINLEMLAKYCRIEIVQDNRPIQEHDKVNLKKMFRLLKSVLSVLKLSIRFRYEFLYLPFSLSLFGGVKTLLVILAFKCANSGNVILHIHRGDFFSRFYRNKLNRIITKLVFSLSSKILVLSENQKLEFIKNFRVDFQVLPNTIEIEMSPRLTRKNTKNFIYISNYLEDKGIVDLLVVFTEILKGKADLMLETFGQFADEKMRQTIIEYKSDRISVNELISNGEKFQKLSEADCLILPSWNEGQPVVILEAMSVGTPVISTITGFIPEMLGPTYPYLAMPADRNTLETKILQFLNDDRKEELSVWIYENYCRNFSRKSHRENLYRIFEFI